jgi:antirestriction protein ArdC
MNTKSYELVTERLIELLENGVAPWRRNFKVDRITSPANFASKKTYKGLNYFLLEGMQYFKGYKSSFWMTFKQAKDAGGKVIKGEKGMPVTYFNFLMKDKNGKKTLDEKQAVEKIPFFKHSYVFNLDQIEGIEDPTKVIDEPLNDDIEPIEAAQNIIDNMPNKPAISIDNNKLSPRGNPCYVPSQDEVRMPEMNRFKDAENFYSVFFHELIHSTGHKSRLDRKGVGKGSSFGDEVYSKEELIAEMGAAFLCNEARIDNSDIMENSAAYLQSWIKALKGDCKLAVQAASAAQKASEYILG